MIEDIWISIAQFYYMKNEFVNNKISNLLLLLFEIKLK